MTTTPAITSASDSAAPPRDQLLAAALADTEPSAARVARMRRFLLALSSFAAGAALVAAPVVAPWEGDGEWIATVAAAPGRAQAGALLYWLGFLLSLGTVLSLVSMVRRRAVRLGLAGTVIALLGAAAQPGLLITDFFQLGMGQTLPLDTALAVEKQMEEYVGLLPLYLTGFIGGTVGTALLTLAAWRAGWLPVYVPVVYGVAMATLLAAPPEPVASVVSWSVLAAFHVLVGTTVWRARDDEWAAGVPMPATA